MVLIVLMVQKMSGEEDSMSATESQLHSNQKHLAKLLKIICKQKMNKDSLSHSNRMIKYHAPYHNSSGEQFYLPKEWKKSTMIGHGRKKEKKHHWQELKISYEFDDDEMNGTQLIRNFSWLGRTNDLIEEMETKENDGSSVD